MESHTMAPGAAIGPLACLQRLQQAISERDLEAMTACFEPDYSSEFPVHPDRIVGGHTRMRQTWAQIFAAVPDLQATIIRYCLEGDTVWAEWEWKGTQAGGGPFFQRGVTIQGVPRDRIAWARMYMEPVEQPGPGAAASLQRDLGGSAGR